MSRHAETAEAPVDRPPAPASTRAQTRTVASVIHGLALLAIRPEGLDALVRLAVEADAEPIVAVDDVLLQATLRRLTVALGPLAVWAATTTPKEALATLRTVAEDEYQHEAQLAGSAS